MSSVAHVKALLDEPEATQPEGLAPVHHGKFELTSHGLIVHGKPSIDEWSEVGQMLAVMERGIAFICGDWIRWGEATYGEMAAQVIDARTWKAETVRAYTWLSEKVPLENRMVDRGLTISHHMAVAALPPGQQRKWLQRALGDGTEHWTVGRLKAEINSGEDSEEVGWWILVQATSATDQKKLLKSLELDGRTCKSVTKKGKAT